MILHPSGLLKEMSKTIVACDWIESFGGAESVLDGILHNIKNAEIYTLWNSRSKDDSNLPIHESWLSKLSLFKENKALAIPFMDFFWRNVPVAEGDTLVASSHLFAHHLRPHSERQQKHVYVHTPARYLWAPEIDLRGRNVAASLISPTLRRRDKRFAQEMTSVAVNSNFIRSRVAECWGLDSIVIYPPVDTNYFSAPPTLDAGDEIDEILENLPSGYLLCFSRFVQYKRLEVAVQMALDLGERIVIAGSGVIYPELEKLIKNNPGKLTLISGPSRSQLRYLYSHARALLFFAVEDFGIVPVEAMAAGTPVIGINLGGVSESVVSGQTGVLLDSVQKLELSWALKELGGISSEECKRRSNLFTQLEFVQKLRQWLPDEILREQAVEKW